MICGLARNFTNLSVIELLSSFKQGTSYLMHSQMDSDNSNVGNIAYVIQANQRSCQESDTSSPGTLGGTDSARHTIDLNLPYVPDVGDSSVDGAVGLDQQCLYIQKREAPDTVGWISMSGTSRTVSNFVNNVRNSSLIISESLTEHQRSIDINGIPAGNTQFHSPTQSSMISSLSSYSREGGMKLLSGTSASVQPFIQSHSSSTLQPLSPRCWMTNSSFVGTSSVSHIPRADHAGSYLQIEGLWNSPIASYLQSTQFPGASPIALLENSEGLTFTEQYTNFRSDISSAFGYQSNALIQPSSSRLVRDLTANGAGDSRRTARWRSVISEIDSRPLPIGEPVTADNEEMLVPVVDGARELGHRDNPIVIEDDEQDGREGDQQPVVHIDVENMSYEELLALEEHVGDANTGLKRRVINALMTRHKYRTKISDGDDCCCICFETYIDGEKIGKLDCGHEFHYHCILKWLRSRNSCPLCKRTALTIAWLFERGQDGGAELFK